MNNQLFVRNTVLQSRTVRIQRDITKRARFTRNDLINHLRRYADYYSADLDWVNDLITAVEQVDEDENQVLHVFYAGVNSRFGSVIRLTKVERTSQGEEERRVWYEIEVSSSILGKKFQENNDIPLGKLAAWTVEEDILWEAKMMPHPSLRSDFNNFFHLSSRNLMLYK